MLFRKLVSVITTALAQASLLKMFLLLSKCWTSAELVAGCLSPVYARHCSSASRCILLNVSLFIHNLVWHLAPWLMGVRGCKLKSVTSSYNALCPAERSKAPGCTVKKIFSKFCSAEFQNIKFINSRWICHSYGSEMKCPKIFLWEELPRDIGKLSYVQLLWFILNLCFLHNHGATSDQWFFVCFFNTRKWFYSYGTAIYSRFLRHTVHESFLKRTG